MPGMGSAPKLMHGGIVAALLRLRMPHVLYEYKYSVEPLPTELHKAEPSPPGREFASMDIY